MVMCHGKRTQRGLITDNNGIASLPHKRKGQKKLNLFSRSMNATFEVFRSFIDIDECTSDTHNCHVDANCTNTKGSFYCTCHTGYSGDGVTCEGDSFNVLKCLRT